MVLTGGACDMIDINRVGTVKNVVLGSKGYTMCGDCLFMGKNVNMVLIRIISQAHEKSQVVGLYEGYQDGNKFNLINGDATKPIHVGIVKDEFNIILISDGYISYRTKCIDWTRVGAVEIDGKIVWQHPKLSINLMVLKNKQNVKRNVKPVSARTNAPYRNLTEFKSWLMRGRLLRVVDWNGKRNRRNMRLLVQQVVKSRGFSFNIFFGNRMIGSDTMNFLPAHCYEFREKGLIYISDPVSGNLVCVLEPMN